ncbi:hypothetical protein [Cohaesibacter sp. CAU 1516]|uniref:capsular polysaccharide export protein, LipB/KpsS family n=1 Tax=Cohaesibacter sp. CAU 1516 TaxID=2576038 RepID=UPI002484C8E5|nr:hypothetical protein [Cohaesibacter sp. CAU 1516]
MEIRQSIRCIANSLKLVLSQREAKFGSPSLDLCIDPAVSVLLGEAPAFARFALPVACESYVGWGRRSGALAMRLARAHNKGVVLMEDGFLRSYHRNDPSMSVNLDDLGIYYDATAPSRLEALIKQPLTTEKMNRIDKVLALWRQYGLSKYNAGQDYDALLPDDYVLVIDQVKNDASIRFGLANGETFQTMLDRAIQENPGLHIVVKMHPDIYTRSKMGHYDILALRSIPNVVVIAENCLPTRLIRQARKVYTVTSQVGFEALIWGRPVFCMGMPFYAGWGLTDDALPAPVRREVVSMEQLAFAAFISYARYIDPIGRNLCEIETIIELLAERKRGGESIAD